VCTACNQPIADTYFEIKGKIFCPPCCEVAQRAQTGREGGFGRFLRALVFGSTAAFVGFLIYFGVAKITGRELGLISLVVGLLVGGAVRAGSANRGGWFYQLLAVFLTYTAIVASYSAFALAELMPQFDKPQQPEAAAPRAPGKAPEAGKAKRPLLQKRAEIVRQAPLAARIMFALFVIVFMYAVPILVGFKSPIGLLIIGFALWEAWKINRHVPFVFSGPFRIAGDLPMSDEVPANA
jgi:hypothetical protein